MRAIKPPAVERPPLPVLTSLRFFAAVIVIFSHQAPPIDLHILSAIAMAGYEAVIFFFVLSGFILAYVYSGDTPSKGMTKPAAEFWWARFLRIAPAYYIGLLLLAPRFLYTALVSKIMSMQMLWLGLVLVPLFQQAWWPPAALLWNTPAWSLSVEFFFYLMFPLLAAVCTRVPTNVLLAGSFALLTVVNLVRFEVMPSAPGETGLHNFIWFSPLLHLPQFIVGVALGRLFLFSGRPSPGWSTVLLYGGLTATVLMLGLKPIQSTFWSSIALVALFGLLILGGAGVERTGKPLAAPFLLLLGEASYSMYILHIPLAFWWDQLVGFSSDRIPVWVSFYLYFALVTAASILLFLGLEQPLRSRFRSAWRKFRRPDAKAAPADPEAP